MTLKLKIILITTLLWMLLLHLLLPIWFIINIIDAVGDTNFYTILLNNTVYIGLTFIVNYLNFPGVIGYIILDEKEQDFLAGEVKRINSKNNK